MNSTERDLSEDKLLPCPFCGGSRAFVQNKGWQANTFMRCPDCQITMGLDNGTVRSHEQTVAAWNRRPSAIPAACTGEAHDHPAHDWRTACLNCGVFRGSDLYTDALASIRAERDMAERAAVEAAIPLEALLMAGQGPLSDAVWDGVRNGVGHVRSMLKARAARAIAGEQKNDA